MIDIEQLEIDEFEEEEKDSNWVNLYMEFSKKDGLRIDTRIFKTYESAWNHAHRSVPNRPVGEVPNRNYTITRHELEE